MFFILLKYLNKMSSSSSVPAPTTSLSATQVDTVLSSISTTLKGKTLAGVLTSLPSLVSSVYQLVVSFNSTSASSQQALVLALIAQGVAKLSLPAEELAVVDTVVQYVVPEIISLLPQIEQGIVTGFTALEQEAETCWTSVKKAFGCSNS